MKRDLPSECENCSLQERWLLHNVWSRQTFRRLCTSCVLKINHGLFCPICFEVYEKLPPNRVFCLRCPSVAHPDCVAKDTAAAFVCPPCSNPNFSFFDSTNPITQIAPQMAKPLVASAHLAWLSITKAANEVKQEADRKVKEAALKRKQARDALDRMYLLKSKLKSTNPTSSSTTTTTAPLPLPLLAEKTTIALARPEHNKKHINNIIRGATPLSVAVGAQHRFKNQSTIKSPVSSLHQLQHPSIVNGNSSNYSTHARTNIAPQKKENDDSLLKNSSDVLGSRHVS